MNHHQRTVKNTKRRRHQKSRNGCFECKRRRVKCDESKPSCERCVLLQDKCVYPTAAQSFSSNQCNEASPQSLSNVVLPSSPNSLLYSEHSPSFAASTCSPSELVEYRSSSATETIEPISDADLYRHYLQHTCRTLTPGEREQSTLQINFARLALENRMVLHSMLAVSAACMCCDMIEKEPWTSTSAVNQLLMTGYRHYNLASEQMRKSISKQDTQAHDHLLASAVLLVPFATASQKINHWISSRSKGKKNSTKRLTTTPRDALILMRGIRTTLQTLYCGDLGLSLESAKESAIPTGRPTAESDISSTLPPSRTHAMFAIVANTSKTAFSKLQGRLDLASFQCSEGCGDDLLACKAALVALDRLRTIAFSSAETFIESAPVPLLQMPSWMRSFANRAANPAPHETLTSLFLSFLVRAPEAYLDMVLPLLDQRLESPINVSSKGSRVVRLTTIQALALEIYAHWSVLMLLVEEESWWIGNLPEVTLTAMVNTYGDNFITKPGPGSSPKPEKWWPEVILNILREIKDFQ